MKIIDEDPGGDGVDEMTQVYVRALAELAIVQSDRPTIADVLNQVLAAARAAMVRTTAISVTAVDTDGRLTTAAATSEAVAELEAIAYERSTGPGVQALMTGQEKVVEDVDGDPRWPGFNEDAQRAGIGAVAAVPLVVNGRTVGVLNLYAPHPGGLGQDVAAARLLAEPAGIVLTSGGTYHRSQRFSSDLERSLSGLATVHQAIGVLMVKRQCDADVAKQSLLATAEASERDLAHTAARIVERAASD